MAACWQRTVMDLVELNSMLCKSATTALARNILLAVLTALLLLSCETIHFSSQTVQAEWFWKRQQNRPFKPPLPPGIALGEAAADGALCSRCRTCWAAWSRRWRSRKPSWSWPTRRARSSSTCWTPSEWAERGRGTGRPREAGRRWAGPGRWKRGPRLAERGWCGFRLRNRSTFTCVHPYVCSARLTKARWSAQCPLLSSGNYALNVAGHFWKPRQVPSWEFGQDCIKNQLHIFAKVSQYLFRKRAKQQTLQFTAVLRQHRSSVLSSPSALAFKWLQRESSTTEISKEKPLCYCHALSRAMFDSHTSSSPCASFSLSSCLLSHQLQHYGYLQTRWESRSGLQTFTGKQVCLNGWCRHEADEAMQVGLYELALPVT